MRRSVIVVGSCLAGFLWGPLVGEVVAAKGDTTLVSRATGAAGQGADDAGAFDPVISDDGRYVAFESHADNLSTEDNDAFINVFVRDLQAGTTTLVSRVSGAGGLGGNASSSDPSISADGRYVAFGSSADNLSGEDVTAQDVFVRDLQANTTTLVSRASGAAGAAADQSSLGPSISADGQHIAFESTATNLSVDADPSHSNIFVRDLQSETTELVSRATGANGAGGDAASNQSSVSADGRYVAFGSSADNLSADDVAAVNDIFVRDLQSDITVLVSRAAGAAGAGGDSASFSPSISGDGLRVAFRSNADNLSPVALTGPSNIFVRDLVGTMTTFVSRASGASGAAADSSSDDPSISANGRYVAFESSADNLSADDDVSQDVFVRDLQSDATTFVSRASGAAGAAGDAPSGNPSISGDGRQVAFESAADNFSNDDSTSFDVFRRTLLSDPPANLTAPRLSGQAVSGESLSCSSGSWSGGAVTRQWRRNGVAIAGQTGVSLALTGTDVGTLIDCLVTATNADGSTSVATDPALVSDPLQGPTGPTGPTGPRGPTGPTGPTGPDGAPGEDAITLLTLLADDKLKAKAGKKLKVSFLTTAAGEAELVLSKGKTELAKSKSVGSDGEHQLKLKLKQDGEPIKKGSYKLKLNVTGEDGQTAKDKAKVKVKKKKK